MAKYESSLELAYKADYEGGVADMIFGYGLKPEELPDDMPSHIKAFVRQLNAVRTSLDEVSRYLNGVVEDAGGYRDY